MKVCLLIPDGVGIRNYLYSDVVNSLANKGNEIIIWHSLGKEQITKVRTDIGVEFEDYEFIHKPELPTVKFIRETTAFARLKKNALIRNNPTILENWNPNKVGYKNKFFYSLVEGVSRLLTNFQSIYSFEKMGFILLRKSEAYKNSLKFLRESKPDILFCTHQRVPSITATVEAAKDLNIKTYTAVFSWDNLPKARLAFRTDKYLVWSDYMKNELTTYYPEINENQIVITSTTQFDFYRNESFLENKVEFASRYGLDASKSWVCYSGSDSISSPNDPEYLEDIAKSLKDQHHIQLIFREVPVESNDRFKEVLERYPAIVNISPEWVKSSQWGSFFPLTSDIKLLVNLAFHCGIVINLGSTMALDFAVFESSALYLNYDQPHEKKRFVREIYSYEHFKTMQGLNAVGWINSKEEILPKILLAFENPNSFGPDRMEWFHRVVNPKLDETSAERIVKALLN